MIVHCRQERVWLLHWYKLAGASTLAVLQVSRQTGKNIHIIHPRFTTTYFTSCSLAKNYIDRVYYSSVRRYHYEDERSFNSSEEQLLHFLERTRQPGWRWNDMKQPSQPPEYSATNSGNDTHRKSKRKPLANSSLSCANRNGTIEPTEFLFQFEQPRHTKRTKTAITATGIFYWVWCLTQR